MSCEIDVGVDILGTEVNDAGTISCQTGDVVTKQVACANVEWWQQVGLASRPPKAQPGKAACQGVVIVRGDHDVCIGQRDIRTNRIYGNLKDGETCLFAAGDDGLAQGRVSIKANGRVVLSTKDTNTNDGHDIYLQVSPTKGLEFSSPWGVMRFGPLGFHVLHVGGARIDLGSIGGLPPPFDVLSSYASIDAGATTIKGGVVSIGTDGGLGNETAVLALQTALTQILAALTAISTTPAVVGSPVLAPAALAPIAAAVTAAATAAPAIGRPV